MNQLDDITFCSCLASVQVSAVYCPPESLLHEGKSVLADAPHQRYQETTTSHGRDLPRKACHSVSVDHERGSDDWRGQRIHLALRSCTGQASSSQLDYAIPKKRMTVINANVGTVLLACPLLVRGYEPAFRMRHILCRSEQPIPRL